MSDKRLIEVAFPIKLASRDSVIYEKFDRTGHLCYKIDTFPLFLRGQGARRLITASALLNPFLYTLLIILLGEK